MGGHSLGRGRVLEVLVHWVIELSSLVNPPFQLDIEQEAICKPLLMKEQTNYHLVHTSCSLRLSTISLNSASLLATMPQLLLEPILQTE